MSFLAVAYNVNAALLSPFSSVLYLKPEYRYKTFFVRRKAMSCLVSPVGMYCSR